MKKLLFVIVYFVASGLYSQNKNVEYFDIDDGISQIVIQTFHQDTYGYLWFGTEDGLNKYDGLKFTNYFHEPNDSNSLSESDIWDITEIPSQPGVLWIATNSGGLNRFNTKKNTITHFFHDTNNPNSLSSNSLLNIIPSQHSPNILWITTREGGLNKFNVTTFENKRFRYSEIDSNTLNSDLTKNCVEDKNGNLWISTGAGICKLNIETEEFERIKLDPTIFSSNKIIHDIELDKFDKDIIWLSSSHNGIISFNTITYQFTPYAFPNDNSQSEIKYIHEIYPSKTGKLFLGTFQSGAKIFDPIERKYLLNGFDGIDLNLVYGRTVADFLEDNSGIIWVGSEGGLAKINPNKYKFHHYLHHPDHLSELPNDIWSFEQNQITTDIVYIGSDWGELLVFDRSTNKIAVDNNFTRLFGNDHMIIAMYHDPENILWLGTLEGIIAYDLSTSAGKLYSHEPGDETTISNNIIYNITPSNISHSNLYVGTVGGFNIFDKSSERFQFINLEENNLEDSPANIITGAIESKQEKDIIWIGTQFGLYKFNLSSKAITKFIHERTDSTSIQSNWIMTIIPSKQYPGKIWLGTDNAGLILFDPNKESFTNFSVADGLPNNAVYGIIEDGDCVWLSTNKGISKFNPKNGEVENFEKSDGLQSNEFNFNAYLGTDDGQLFFGGIKGFNYFYPNEIKANENKPIINISSIKHLDEELKFNRYDFDKNTLEIEYEENIINIEFEALEFSDPQNNQYKYYLENFQKTWINSGNKNRATYTNLDPGEYTFHVKGSNNDGVWSENEASFNLIVNPPFWMTWYFRLSVILFITFSIGSIIYLKLKKPLEIERLRTRIASDLHDDIGSSLTNISMNAGLLPYETDKIEINKRIAKLEEKSREVITTMSDIVWSIDSRNNNMKNLYDRMKNFAFKICEDSDIEILFNVEDKKNQHRKIDIDTRQNVYFIFTEALHNSLKHSESKKIEVQIKNDQKEFLLSVYDNGIGLGKNIGTQGNGLRNMKMRAKNINGIIEFVNHNGLNVTLRRKSL